MSGERPGVPRGVAAAYLWYGMWGTLLTLLLTQIADAWQRAAPAAVWLLWLLPLLILLPGLLRDRLRSVAWLSFVSLMYFVWAVLRLFAEPHSPRAQVELVAVVALFLCSMFYVRQRGPELRAANPVSAEE